jgi:predicted nuclease with TOPRIM domain
MTGSAGVTLSDLTKPLTKADLMSLQAEVNSLQDETMLKDVHDELARLENQLGSLERQLSELRNRGYNLEKGLEVDIQILSTQWERIRKNTESTISLQTALLSKQMESVKVDLARVMGMSSNLEAARSPYMQLRSKIASLEAQSDSAEVTVYTQYDEYADEVEAIEAHLEWVSWMQTALETASFRLLATENAIAAVEALFVHPDWEPENGLLFLTDQRLLWEDRVDAYELKIDLPLQEVLDVDRITEGDGEALQFSFGSAGPVPLAIFKLSQPVAEDWLVMVGRARSGGYIQDQVVEVSAEELERIRNAPQQCSNCGAAFTAPILRGQHEIVCEYCGIVERI